jgi:hypothetical protein
VRIVWIKHAAERQKEWEKKLGITRQEVEDTLISPAQIVPGDRDVLIAQSRGGEGLLRIPFLSVAISS